MERFTAIEAYKQFEKRKVIYIEEQIPIVYNHVIKTIKNAIETNIQNIVYIYDMDIPIYGDVRDKVIELLKEDGYNVENKLFASYFIVSWDKPKEM